MGVKYPEPLLLSTDDTRGGAARAAYRLHQSLRAEGVPSEMLVRRKHSNDSSIHGPESELVNQLATLRYYLEFLPVLPAYFRGGFDIFSPAWVPDRVHKKVNEINPDIIHAHWIPGLLRPETFPKFDAPIVYTLHDHWPVTGGCHVPGNCERFTERCGKCPKLNSTDKSDISNWLWERKNRSWSSGQLEMVFVAPSTWLAKRAKRSPLLTDFDVEVIPNGIDTRFYKPRVQGEARSEMNLPPEKTVILFGAANPISDKNKGYGLLMDSLMELGNAYGTEEIEIVVFGTDGEGITPQHHYPTQHLGQMSDEQLSYLYPAADVLVVPSKQENLSNIILESLACGTPVVAFDAGGTPDMVMHKQNGYLASPYNTQEFAEGIQWIIESPDVHLRTNARQTILDGFTQESVANRYMALYKSLHE